MKTVKQQQIPLLTSTDKRDFETGTRALTDYQ